MDNILVHSQLLAMGYQTEFAFAMHCQPQCAQHRRARLASGDLQVILYLYLKSRARLLSKHMHLWV